jgi:uncharacterized protein
MIQILISIAVSLMVIISLICMLNVSSNAQSLSNNNYTLTISGNGSNSTLSVSGLSSTKVKPDKVTLSLGVETTNKTADGTLSLNSKLMNKTIAALKRAGVRENETSTSSFSITPNYNYSQSSRGLLTGFTVSNSIIIESHNINATSKWIDTAVSAGANNINSIDFGLSAKKLEQIKNSLIKKAIDTARGKADIAASALRMSVVGVKSINLMEFRALPFVQQESLAARAAPSPSPTGGPSTPIIAGEQQISQNVDIVFVIGEQR